MKGAEQQQVRCSFCSKEILIDRSLTLGSQTACVKCKHLLVQELREGVQPTQRFPKLRSLVASWSRLLIAATILAFLVGTIAFCCDLLWGTYPRLAGLQNAGRLAYPAILSPVVCGALFTVGSFLLVTVALLMMKLSFGGPQATKHEKKFDQVTAFKE